MGSRFAFRWLTGLLMVAMLAAAGLYTYNLGVSHGIAESGRVAAAPGTGVPVVIWPGRGGSASGSSRSSRSCSSCSGSLSRADYSGVERGGGGCTAAAVLRPSSTRGIAARTRSRGQNLKSQVSSLRSEVEGRKSEV